MEVLLLHVWNERLILIKCYWYLVGNGTLLEVDTRGTVSDTSYLVQVPGSKLRVGMPW